MSQKKTVDEVIAEHHQSLAQLQTAERALSAWKYARTEQLLAEVRALLADCGNWPAWRRSR